MNYRNLKKEEIDVLVDQGCTAEDWNKITVKNGFSPKDYRRVNFFGEIKLGLTGEKVIGTAGLSAPSGIYDATLSNCSIGDNVLISHVAECIINYDIEDFAYIANIGSIICSGSRAFGNGTPVNVLDETGGRKVLIYEGMTAQIAYMMAMYRHDKALTGALYDMVNAYSASVKSSRGKIGRYAKLTNVDSVTDVNFGYESYANGSSLLWDGTLGPRSFTGPNVVAEHFILASEATVDKGAIIKNVFVGQAAEVSNGFLAHDSLIFCNCALESGEGVAMFAGPHTVSMHKSTLLIGGMFSFFNAGSGTNQSNHLYKTGPVHQGIMERGSKTGSNSYVMWPARFGYFTLVTGNHCAHPDTSVLPYSYAIGEGRHTTVIPAGNLATVGTIRDILKWKKRDRRSAELPKLDLVNYRALNPVTTSLMYRAINFLNNYEKKETLPDSLKFKIKASAVNRGRQLYALGVDYFMGYAVIEKVMSLKPDSAVNEQLKPVALDNVNSWIDIAGMIAPKSEIDKVCEKVVQGSISSLSSLAKALAAVNDNYLDWQWAYVATNFELCYSVSLKDVTLEGLEAIVQRWTETVSALDHMRKADALKEFNETAMTGFGIDGDSDCRLADFDAVRGDADECTEITAIHTHYADALQRGYAAIRHLEKIIKSSHDL